MWTLEEPARNQPREKRLLSTGVATTNKIKFRVTLICVFRL